MLAIPRIIFLWIVLILISCNSKEAKEMRESGQSETTEQNYIPARTMKIYTVPAPLQAGTAIRALNIDYQEKLLPPVNRVATYYSTNFLRAVNIGMLTVDMGYSTLYEQNQRALYYLNEIEDLSKELDVQSGFERSVVERFKNNIHNRDSLYYIILESFGKTQKYLIADDRELSGILISAGSFIESLYLASAIACETDHEKLSSLVAMQQLFLYNISGLLQKYKDQKEVNDLLEQLNTIKDAYKGITLVYPDWENNHLKSVQPVKITKDQMKKIRERTEQVRKKIMG